MKKDSKKKPKIAVHKFASCDGCQLAFLNAGENLVTLAKITEIVHFAESGSVEPDAVVDIAFIEGSITTQNDIERIKRIRRQTRYLITIGACATAGGLQALRNISDADTWVSSIYPNRQYIQTLSTSTPVSHHVKVDLELWGCPVSAEQVFLVIHDLLNGVLPHIHQEKVCMECKRQQNVCVMITQGTPCMGPVTQTGCNAICPRMERDCYACFGPAENSNTHALSRQFSSLGLSTDDIVRRFRFINSHAPVFDEAARKCQEEE